MGSWENGEVGGWEGIRNLNGELRGVGRMGRY